MNNPRIYYYLLKRFFNYYRLPLSVINDEGDTLYTFPTELSGHILPKSIIKRDLYRYQNSQLDYYTPFLAHAPYNSFISIIPLQTSGYLFVGPSFSHPLTEYNTLQFPVDGLTQNDFDIIKKITSNLPLVDESYLADAISLLVLLIHYEEVTPEQIIRANNLTTNHNPVFNSSHITEKENEDLMLFETQVEEFIQEGNEQALVNLWSNFTSSIKEDFLEYMYAEHHLMIPLLSSSRSAAIRAGAVSSDITSIFHSTISQISTRGSLSVNLKNVERATIEMCQLVRKNRSIPFRADLCAKCEAYINDNITNKITASDIAKHCGIDRSLVFDIFRNNYNMSLTEYINEAKMKRARTLLLHSSMPVSEIASSLGYCSSSYFTKKFSSYYNITPSAFRTEKTLALKPGSN